MEDKCDIIQINEIHPKLNTKNPNLTLSIGDIRNLAILKFGGINSFGRQLGVTKGMASRLLSGDYIPLLPKSIQKIADLLQIDPIVLTQIYYELKNQGA